MPTAITTGAASAKGYGFGAKATDAVYVEDVFSTYLYTGNGSSQTITNNTNLSTKGGLVWIKSRAAASNTLFDTSRGATKRIYSDDTLAQDTNAESLTAFNTTGFSVGSNSGVNASSTNYVSWTFRKQAKFFDIVTWTGNGSNRTISHNLGSTPGCIMVKRTDTTGNWQVYHRSLTSAAYSIQLNLTNTEASATTVWNSTAPTSTVFSVGTDATVNANGGTYVAYLFAHDAGGFGLSGTDSVISCGTFTEPASGYVDVTLGWEPQFIIAKLSWGSWYIFDTMRGMPVSPPTARLAAESAAAEVSATSASGPWPIPTATGFQWKSGFVGNAAWVYIAIRRGPMKVPTDATKVFYPSITSTSYAKVTTGFPVDMNMAYYAGGDGRNGTVIDRVRGYPNTYNTTSVRYIVTSSADAENTAQKFSPTYAFDSNNSYNIGIYGSDRFWSFGRSPSFFDIVCYSGTGSARTISHNLGVAPSLIIAKSRTTASYNNWLVYCSSIGATQYLVLNSTQAANAIAIWNDTAPTASVFSVGTNANVNQSGINYVAYLFGTCAGVSKVGSYTGTGTTKQIDCGFTGGARFVMIKRTDSTGDWYFWDTARGIVSGNDPYSFLNSTAGEVTNTDYIDPYSAGFEISSTAPAAINANGGTFIYLAIA